MKTKWYLWMVSAGIVLLLTIGVPFLINELYKNNSGYMTIWGAADVLSYYGLIVAALIGVAGVISPYGYRTKTIVKMPKTEYSQLSQ